MIRNSANDFTRPAGAASLRSLVVLGVAAALVALGVVLLGQGGAEPQTNGDPSRAERHRANHATLSGRPRPEAGPGNVMEESPSEGSPGGGASDNRGVVESALKDAFDGKPRGWKGDAAWLRAVPEGVPGGLLALLTHCLTAPTCTDEQADFVKRVYRATVRTGAEDARRTLASFLLGKLLYDGGLSAERWTRAAAWLGMVKEILTSADLQSIEMAALALEHQDPATRRDVLIRALRLGCESQALAQEYIRVIGRILEQGATEEAALGPRTTEVINLLIKHAGEIEPELVRGLEQTALPNWRALAVGILLAQDPVANLATAYSFLMSGEWEGPWYHEAVCAFLQAADGSSPAEAANLIDRTKKYGYRMISLRSCISKPLWDADPERMSQGILDGTIVWSRESKSYEPR